MAECKIFIHGLESSDKGTKAVFFREKFPDMIIPHFVGSLKERMIRLNGILSEEQGILLVGSSFGGLMASIFAMENESRVEKLILLAPAINMFPFAGYENRKISIPVHIYHGLQDDVIPLDAVKTASERIFRQFSFQEVDDDHFLHQTFMKMDWDRLLSS